MRQMRAILLLVTTTVCWAVDEGPVPIPLVKKLENGSLVMHEVLEEALMGEEVRVVRVEAVGVVEVNASGCLTKVLGTAMGGGGELVWHDDDVPVWVTVVGEDKAVLRVILTVHIVDCSPEAASPSVRFGFALLGLLSHSIVVNYNLDEPGDCPALMRELSATADYVIRPLTPSEKWNGPLLPPLNLVTSQPDDDADFQDDIALNLRSPYHHIHTIPAHQSYQATPHHYGDLRKGWKHQVKTLVAKVQKDIALPRHTPWAAKASLIPPRIARAARLWTDLSDVILTNIRGNFIYYI